ALVRANTIFAAAPLALFLLRGDPFSRRLWPQALACLLVPTVILVGTATFDKFIARAKPEHAESSLFLFDLIGISNRIGDNLVPGRWSRAQAQKLPNCYGPDKWDHTDEGDCAFVTKTLDDKGLFGGPAIREAWQTAIVAHPAEYLAHRFAFTNAMLRWLG